MRTNVRATPNERGSDSVKFDFSVLVVVTLRQRGQNAVPYKNIEQRKAYYQAAYAADPEKFRTRTAAWRKANAERVAATNKAWRARNAEKVKAARDAWNLRNAEKVRKQARQRAGLPAATRPAPEACECCNKPFAGRSAHLDHCHATGAFRGWLCFACNTGIGKLGDTAEGLQRALTYLGKKGTTCS